MAGRTKAFWVAMRPGKRRVLPDTPEEKLLNLIETAKAHIGAKGGHTFRVIKQQFGFQNESEGLVPQAKKYNQEYGCYLEKICADRIYINTKNRNFCTRNNIRLSGKRLGRPPKDPEINAVHKQLLSADQRKQNEVEGIFGSGKRKYVLKLIKARLAKGAETLTDGHISSERVMRQPAAGTGVAVAAGQSA